MIRHSDGCIEYSTIEMHLAYLIMDVGGIYTTEPLHETIAWKRARQLIARAKAEDQKHSEES